ncbi:DUF5133 domain-containing protein [Streptomyces sp. NBC_01764]|uniref:DUF5133 domain-containing protein n=1 Tax=Streptomyces sp. NBC_01764 TaxID=2975935 RepID=UPI00338FC7C5
MPGLPCRDHGFDELPLLIGEIARVRLAHAHATTQANPERLTGSNAPPSHHRAMTSPTERHIPHSQDPRRGAAGLPVGAGGCAARPGNPLRYRRLDNVAYTLCVLKGQRNTADATAQAESLLAGSSARVAAPRTWDALRGATDGRRSKRCRHLRRH